MSGPKHPSVLVEPGPECPSIEELAECAQGESPASPGGNLLQAHIDSCSRCQSELALMETFQSAEATPQETADVEWILERLPGNQAAEPAEGSVRPEREQGMAFRFLDWLTRFVSSPLPALAAVAALIFLGVGVRYLTMSPPVLQAPEGSPSLIERGKGIRLQSPVGDLEEIPETLEWEPVKGASDYLLILTYSDGLEAGRFVSVSNVFSWSQEARGLIEPHRPLYVEIRARDPQGTTLSTSARFRMMWKGK